MKLFKSKSIKQRILSNRLTQVENMLTWLETGLITTAQIEIARIKPIEPDQPTDNGHISSEWTTASELGINLIALQEEAIENLKQKITELKSELKVLK